MTLIQLRNINNTYQFYFETEAPIICKFLSIDKLSSVTGVLVEQFNIISIWSLSELIFTKDCYI